MSWSNILIGFNHMHFPCNCPTFGLDHICKLTLYVFLMSSRYTVLLSISFMCTKFSPRFKHDYSFPPCWPFMISLATWEGKN